MSDIESQSVMDALRSTLGALDLDEEDQAACALAWRLAEAIDTEGSARALADLAGKLLQVLESLGATPAARKALVKGVDQGAGARQRSALDELRERRDRRKNGAATVDATTT
ncbi:terminase small subunit [Saccharomonospora cyanea]|uniref:Terminase small subunit actinomycetes phage-type domain-containing protein n=1 Tax=Saccharomonospora cyanea NA-134 TaxID=882082 RepID=H5XG57_9PSEU|nr:hypothetical protein [Saccharomonospora cyanea]EHR62639.1 hypothetical protein SaccyDRAFT_3812 [Saccharomonospora cyanea NA-134]